MIRIICVIVWLLLSLVDQAAAAPDAIDIIRRTDLVRNPDQPFISRVIITEYQQARETDSMQLRIRSKQAEDSGQFRTLVSFEKPLRDRGKLMLRNGSDVWFFDPNAKASVRISPQQRLLGQASNGDIMTANYALDYSATLVGEEQVQDADRQLHQAWHLYMTARPDREGLTYAAIDYWVDKHTDHLIKGRYYAPSGHLLKQVYYRGYKDVLGRLRPTEVIIIDGVDTAKVTRMSFSDFSYTQIPEQWLQRAYLPHFQGE